MDCIIWTGNNVDEVKEFAMKSNFGFTVGSNYGKTRWYHRVLERLSVPRDDKTVLEIFPDRPDEARTNLEKLLAEIDDERLDIVLETIESQLSKDYNSIYIIRRLFAAIKEERNQEYIPWHWTTALPGDKIFSDGTVIRYEDWWEKDPKRWINQPWVDKSDG